MSDPATQQKIDHFAEELLGFMDKNFPELSKAIAARASSGDSTESVNQGASVTLNASSQLRWTQGFVKADPIQSSGAKVEEMRLADTMPGSATINDVGVVNTPITPETSGAGGIFRFLLALLIVAALVFLYLHRR